MLTPESLALQQIDQFLAASGWTVQNRAGKNLFASHGVAVRLMHIVHAGEAARAILFGEASLRFALEEVAINYR